MEMPEGSIIIFKAWQEPFYKSPTHDVLRQRMLGYSLSEIVPLWTSQRLYVRDMWEIWNTSLNRIKAGRYKSGCLSQGGFNLAIWFRWFQEFNAVIRLRFCIRFGDMLALPAIKINILDAQIIRPNLLSLPEGTLFPQHDDVINVPIPFALAETVKPDHIVSINVEPETVLGVCMEGAEGTVPTITRSF